MKVAEHYKNTADKAITYDTRLTGFAFQLFHDFCHDIFSKYGQAIGADLDIPSKSIWEIGADRRRVSTYINSEGKEKKEYPAWGFEEYKLLLSLNMFEEMTGFIKVNHIYSALRTKMKSLEVSSCGALADTVKQLAKIQGFFTGIKCSQLLIYDLTDEHADSVKKRNELIFYIIINRKYYYKLI